MHRETIAQLTLYPDERDLSIMSKYNLFEGENVIGSSSVCDIRITAPSISDRHCKITISDGEYSIEDLGSASGTFRMTNDNPRQKLKPNKEYDLTIGKPFYLANKYRCVFELKEKESLKQPQQSNGYQSTLLLPDNEEDEYYHEPPKPRNRLSPTDNMRTQLMPTMAYGNDEIQGTLVIGDDFMPPPIKKPNLISPRSEGTDDMKTQLMPTIMNSDEDYQSTLVLDNDFQPPPPIQEKKSFKKSNNILKATDNMKTQIMPTMAYNDEIDIDPTLVVPDMAVDFSRANLRNNRLTIPDNFKTQLVPTIEPDDIQTTQILGDFIEPPAPKKKALSPKMPDNMKTQLMPTIMDDELQSTMLVPDLYTEVPAQNLQIKKKNSPRLMDDAKTQVLATMADETEAQATFILSDRDLPLPVVNNKPGMKPQIKINENARTQIMPTLMVPSNNTNGILKKSPPKSDLEKIMVGETLQDDDEEQLSGNVEERSFDDENSRNSSNKLGANKKKITFASSVSVPETNDKADELADLFGMDDHKANKFKFDSSANNSFMKNFKKAEPTSTLPTASSRLSAGSNLPSIKVNKPDANKSSFDALMSQDLVGNTRAGTAAAVIKKVSPSPEPKKALPPIPEKKEEPPKLKKGKRALFMEDEDDEEEEKKEIKKKPEPEEEEPKGRKVRVANTNKKNEENDSSKIKPIETKQAITKKGSAIKEETTVSKEPEEERKSTRLRKPAKKDDSPPPKPEPKSKKSDTKSQSQSEEIAPNTRTRRGKALVEESSEEEPPKPANKRGAKKAPEPEPEPDVPKSLRSTRNSKPESIIEEKPKPVTAAKGKRGATKDDIAEVETKVTQSKKVKTEPEPPKKAETKKETAAKEKKGSKKAEVVEEEESSNNSDLFKRNAYQVMFSGFDKKNADIEKDKKIMINMGVRFVEEKDKNFNVLVMDKLRRTVKFLLAINKGVHVVSYDWIKKCIKENLVLNPSDFLISDREIETKYKFKVSTTLQKAKRRTEGILYDYKVHFPANIKPSVEEIKLLVESCDGVYLKTKPSAPSDDIIIIIADDDSKANKAFKDAGFTPYTTELIYSGILHQNLDLKNNFFED